MNCEFHSPGFLIVDKKVLDLPEYGRSKVADMSNI